MEVVVTARDEIRAELRALRKLPGILDEAKILQTPVLLRGLGGGNADLALSRLLVVRRRHAVDPDIAAAFATMGFENDADTVQERLDHYSLLQGADARTVRRWSDAGIEKLAVVILSKTPWVNPKAFLTLDGDEYGLAAQLQLDVPRSVGMRLPILAIDNDERELSLTKVRELEDLLVFKSASLRFDRPAKSGCVLIKLYWRGELVPTYVLDVLPSIDCASRSYFRLYEIKVELSVA